MAGISGISRPYASQHSACSPDSRADLPSALGSLDLRLTPPLHERTAAHTFDVNLTSSPASGPDVTSALDYSLAQLPALSRPLVVCSHTSSSVPRSPSSAAACSLDTILTSPSRELATAHVSDITPTPQSDLHAVALLTEAVTQATLITRPRRIDAAEAKVGSSCENSNAIPTLARGTPSPVPSSHGVDGTAGSEHTSPLPSGQHNIITPASDLEPNADATVAVTADLVVKNHVGPTRDNAEGSSLRHSGFWFPLGSSNQLLEP